MDANQQIVLDNLSVRYRGEDEAALKGISLTAKTGQIIGIIGNSRSGKTTLCDVLSGIIPNIVSGHVSGTVRLGEFSPFESFDEYNFHTGVVLQNTAGQLSGLSDTVFDEIAFGLINQGMSEEEAAKSVVRAACQMGLEDLLEQAPDTLSGGQTQRLAIASEIAFDPEFLIMDDPTSQMDPVGRKEFFEWLAGCSEKTIFIVSNEVEWGLRQMDKPETEVERITEEVLQEVGLADKMDENPYDLSLSERKLLSIATVVAVRPKILLFDEPMMSLDWPSRKKITAIFRYLADRGHVVITITHDMDWVLEEYEDVYAMAHGELVYSGKTSEFFESPSLVEEVGVLLPKATEVKRELDRYLKEK